MFEDFDQSASARLPAGEWEHLAALTGFKPDPPPGKHSATATLPEPIEVTPRDRPSNSDETPEKAPSQDQPASLLDPEDFLESEEDKAATKATLWTSPWAKAGFVASIIGVGIGSIGLFLWSVQNIKPTLTPAQSPQQSQVEEQPSIDPDQEQIGNLKTVNALGTQAQALNKQTQMRQSLAKPSQGQTSKVPQTIQPISPAGSTRTSAPTTYSPVAYNPPPAAVPISPPPVSVRSFSATGPASSVDPQTAWQEAMSAGSYGEGSGEANAGPTPVAAPTLVANQTDEAVANPLEDSRYQADAEAILSGTTSHFVSALPGAIAAATLQTPIFWAQDLKPEQQPQRFAIRLNSAIPAANGTEALPAGTQLIAQVGSISESGLVQLSVTEAVSPSGQTIPLPVGALGVAGDQGKPILAELQNTNGGQIAGMDMQTALFGALGQVGQLLNRPTNESTTTSPYLSSTSVSNGNTNILGGILQGAFTPLMQQVQQRNQQAMQSVLDRPSLWVVPANQPLQIFVNSSFGVAQP